MGHHTAIRKVAKMDDGSSKVLEIEVRQARYLGLQPLLRVYVPQMGVFTAIRDRQTGSWFYPARDIFDPNFVAFLNAELDRIWKEVRGEFHGIR